MPANARKVKEIKDQSIAGQLWGGNLSMVASLVGTPHMPQVSGGILWLEDVGEHPYRSERLLTQLLHAGVLKKQKAVVLAQFSGWKPLPNDKGYGYPTVADWLRSQIKAPVLTGLPFGHVPTKLCLPQFTRTRLLTEGRDALLYWG